MDGLEKSLDSLQGKTAWNMPVSQLWKNWASWLK